MFAKKWIQSAKTQKIGEDKVLFLGSNLSPEYVVYTLFISNFIGIAFARTLHYQFYSWYFHSLPLLLLNTKLPALIMVIMLGSIEYSFNVFPATPLSSGILQCSHLLLLVASYYADVPDILKKRLKQS
jgi:alpha-1,3-mannosyltransferase